MNYLYNHNVTLNGRQFCLKFPLILLEFRSKEKVNSPWNWKWYPWKRAKQHLQSQGSIPASGPDTSSHTVKHSTLSLVSVLDTTPGDAHGRSTARRPWPSSLWPSSEGKPWTNSEYKQEMRFIKGSMQGPMGVCNRKSLPDEVRWPLKRTLKNGMYFPGGRAKEWFIPVSKKSVHKDFDG